MNLSDKEKMVALANKYTLKKENVDVTAPPSRAATGHKKPEDVNVPTVNTTWAHINALYQYAIGKYS